MAGSRAQDEARGAGEAGAATNATPTSADLTTLFTAKEVKVLAAAFALRVSAGSR